MFDEPTAAVLRMIWRASNAYKHWYGEYPETVGLDIFSRWREWQKTPYVEQFHFRVMDAPPPTTWAITTVIHYTNVAVKVVPAVFGNVARGGYGQEFRCTDPRRGRDEVWCKRGEHEVCIHLIFTDQGYHAVICEGQKREEKASVA